MQRHGVHQYAVKVENEGEGRPFLIRHAGRIAWAALLLALSASAQEDTFRLSTTTTDHYTPAALGNGSISLETAPLAITPAHSYLAGVYDATPGDSPRIAAAPYWNRVEVSNGSEWLGAAGIEEYRQSLNLFDGTLATRYTWSAGGKTVAVEVEQFVSRDQPELAAQQLVLTPRFSGTLVVRFGLLNWPAPHRYLLDRLTKLNPAADRDHALIWYPGHLDVSEVRAVTGRRAPMLSLLATAPGNVGQAGEALAIKTPGGAGEPKARHEADGASLEVALPVRAGEQYRFREYAAIATSRDRSQAEHAAEAARRTGWDQLMRANAQAWAALWQADILVKGDLVLQRTIHALEFHLLAATRAGSAFSIPPMGLSSADYLGHIFWDADTFMFPALLVLHPEIARSQVEFRARTRLAAVANARKNRYRGAMYPWEAGPDGVETTPRFAFQNASSENHVNGDVALAAWQYWLATGDRAWLTNSAWPILRDTADFWASRVSLNAAQDRYEIGNVVAVKESDIGVSNDPYTNAVARKNLQLAVQAARLVGAEPHPAWARIAAKMFVPASDSPLLWFPLERTFSRTQTAQALQAALPRIDRERGAMMGGEFYPILAAQIGDRAIIGQFFGPLLQPYLRPPYAVAAETPENQNTIFLTGAGAFLQQFLFGYSGLRLTDHGLEKKFSAVLPPGIDHLTLQNVSSHGRKETLVF